MPRPSVIRRALTTVVTVLIAVTVAVTLAGLAGLVPAAQGAQGAPTARAETDPLLVHLDDITPVARKGADVDISGTVTNTTTETWTRVNLHAFSSQSPILDAPLLAASAATDPAEFVGGRVTTPGTFDTVEILEPGQTEYFNITVPVEALGIDAGAGVYWIGVHALGDSSVPRDDFADGKARTFIPFLPSSKAQVPVSIVLPLRGPVWYAPDGSLARTGRWLRFLSEGGRYDALLDAAVGDDTTSHSILVDPAVLTAISRLSVGNPPRTLVPDPTVPGQEPTVEPEPEPDGETPEDPLSPSLATVAPTPEIEMSEEEEELASLASVWMATFLQTVTSRDVLTLPYGDLDVSAASRSTSTRYGQATARSREVMATLGLAYRPAIAPPTAVLRPEALASVAADETILLGDTSFAVPPQTPTSMVRTLGHRVVVTSTGAAAGGPGPTSPMDPLAMRQRLLSEAALRLADSGQPMVLTLPASWRSEESQVLLDALDQPWIDPVTVSELATAPAVGVPARSLVYTEEDRAAELDEANFAQADDLTAAATLMEQVLTLQTTVEHQVLDEALTTLSNQHRPRPRVAARSAAALEEYLRDQLGSIRVQTVKAVTLSSDSGPLGTTLINELDQPVTVALEAETSDDISLTGTGTRQLAPGSRTQARLQATASRPGIHRVRLFVAGADGTPLGSSTELPIRAAQVSGFIWLAMAVGAALLFGAIALRLWRRVRRHRRAEVAQ